MNDNAQSGGLEPTPPNHPPNDQARTRPLSSTQERKLVEYLEERLLEVTRNFKKRSHPSTTLPSLSLYLTATHPLLALILQIPPVYPSSYLRTSLLLRLTGEVLSSIIGYVPGASTLAQLLAWLDDLDRGWLTVLRQQAWDPAEHVGVDVDTLNDSDSSRSTPISQTDRTRLRSMLIAGTDQMEEWLSGMDTPEQDFRSALETLGLQQSFDDLFTRTLAEMGSLDGSMNDPKGMESTC
ncbi:uncharacterized protein FIBRA_06748 [Fibroporia radiculosa]|uniref:Uncharacterized protein n=1 Tax=Fibroporia radiculosa TaxID=599839 RepID=J4HZL3_9APHY|nr:uncharacterized protein FIBRA_06748 [Fibroporia radiculosa]CCM04567.1 predicted protein [Fibroporia radiculosa]